MEHFNLNEKTLAHLLAQMEEAEKRMMNNLLEIVNDQRKPKNSNSRKG